MPKPFFTRSLALTLCLGITTLAIGTEYDERSLATKKHFADLEYEAINEPFVGVRTADGIQPGLFPIHATGESTAAIVEAAQAFIASLTQAQKLKTQFAVDDTEWRRWFNVDNGIYVRQGVSLLEMNPNQKAAARNLMATTLGGEPITTTSGKYAGNVILQDEQNQGLALRTVYSIWSDR